MVVTARSRARLRIVAAPSRESPKNVVAAHVQVRCVHDQVPGDIIDRECKVGTGKMKSGTLSIGANRQNTDGGLEAGFSNDVARIYSVTTEHPNQQVPRRVIANRANAAGQEPELGKSHRGSRGGARRSKAHLFQ